VRLSPAFLGLTLGAVLTGPLRAHDPTPSELVADLNSEVSRAESGVVRATRDPKLPRLLVIEVGGRWYQRPEEARRGAAAAWRAIWQKAVPGGLVSVLDALSGEPVVRYRPGRVEVAPSAPRPSTERSASHGS